MMSGAKMVMSGLQKEKEKAAELLSFYCTQKKTIFHGWRHPRLVPFSDTVSGWDKKLELVRVAPRMKYCQMSTSWIILCSLYYSQCRGKPSKTLTCIHLATPIRLERIFSTLIRYYSLSSGSQWNLTPPFFLNYPVSFSQPINAF